MKTLFLILCATLFTVATFAQASVESVDLAPKVTTPSFSSIEEVKNYEVDLNTGVPEINIPIYNIDYAGMNVPISISYDASGVKVDEVASNIGLKWKLNYGGVLNRIMRGGADEGANYPGNSSVIDLKGYYSSFGLSNLDELSDFSGTAGGIEFTNLSQDLSSGALDAQPDIFSFTSSMGMSGRFIFNEDRDVIPYALKDYRVQEYYNQNRLQSLKSPFYKWEITSPAGLMMTFGNDKVQKSQMKPLDDFVYGNNYVTNSWFLTSLKNNTNNKVINFEYSPETYSNVFYYNSSVVSCMDFDNQPISNCSLTKEESYSQAIHSGGSGGHQLLGLVYNSLSPLFAQKMENVVSTQRINKITAGLIEVEFISSNRNDLAFGLYNTSTAKKIDIILIKYAGEVKYKYKFNYDYFLADENLNLTAPSFSSSEEWEQANLRRLKLTSLQKMDTDDNVLETYQFFYDESNNLPPRATFAKDKWGYYNGALSNESAYPRLNDNVPDFSEKADRNVSEAYAKTATLNKIIYPTGGSVEFDYESHVNDEVVSPSSNFGWQQETTVGGFAAGYDTGGQSLNLIEHSINSSKDLRINPTLYIGGSYPGDSMKNDSYCINQEFEKAIEIIDLSDGSVVYSRSFTDIIDESGYVSNYINLDPVYLENGNYNVKTYFTYRPTDGRPCLSSKVTIYSWDAIPPTGEDYLVGGLRVNSILYKDSDGSPAKSKSFSYSHPNLLDNPKFFYQFDYDIDLTFSGYRNLEGLPDFYFDTNMNFKSGTFDYISPGETPYRVNFSKSHITYQNATETDGNGTVEYTFYPSEDYFAASGYSSSLNYPFSPLEQNSLAGKLKIKRFKNNLGDIVQEEFYNYQTTVVGEIKGITTANINSYNQNIKIIPSNIYTIRPEDSKLISTNFISYLEDKSISENKTFYYEGNGHNSVSKIVQNDSKGQEITTVNLYPPDLLGETGMSSLISMNRISTPIEIKHYSGSLSENNLKATQKKDYSIYSPSPNLVLLNSIKRSKTAETLDKDLEVLQYNSFGNPIEISKPDGPNSVFLYGYNYQYLIARIKNATASEVAQQLGVSVSGLETLDEGNLGAINSLRSSMPDAMITTYTHEPLFGVETITDPQGLTTTNIYDDFGRLKEVRDSDNYLLQEYQYNYQQ